MNEKATRHQRRMCRKKTVMDQRIAAAQEQRGLLLVHTGSGKGKSTAAFGMAMRALGHDRNVGIVQFIKSTLSGEVRFLQRFPEQVSVHVMGEGFTWETQDRNRDIVQAEKAWMTARSLLGDERISLVILDELNIVLKYGYLPLETVLNDIASRPFAQHVIITGRWAPAELVERADTVTDMKAVKHAFQQGIKAQPCIEF